MLLAFLQVGIHNREFMESSFADRTSVSLLGRLRQESVDQEAWGEFERRYGRKIYQWCRKRKLQEADAQDVTQTCAIFATIQRRASGLT